MSINYSGFAFPKPEKKEKEKITRIKGKKHKETKETDISDEVKKIVWERDNHRCIICNKEVPMKCANAHYIKRSQGGLGIEQNICTLCPECHFEEDMGQNTKLYEQKMKTYLKSKYDEWDEKKLYFKKY